jgi:hypothetical protein
MNSPTNLPIHLLLEQAKRAKIDQDPMFQKMIRCLAITKDPRLFQTLARRTELQSLHRRFDPYPFYVPSIEQMLQGDTSNNVMILGRVKNTYTPFLIHTMLLSMHCGIFGRTGVGKSTLLYWIASLAMIQGIAVHMFDRDKQDYRHLKRMFPNLLVLNVGKQFKLNPLEPPPGVAPKTWIQVFVENFCRANALLDGSESLLLRLVTQLYKEAGVFDGSDNYPSLFCLFNKCKAFKVSRFSREAGFKDSIKNRLEAYLITSPELYDCSKGFSLLDLSQKSVVFELSGFPEKQAKFLMSHLLYWLFHHRIARQEYDQGLRNLCIIDECKWLMPPHPANSAIPWPPIAYMLAQLRALGVGLVMADQTLALDESLFVNSVLKITFGLGSGKDLKRAKEVFSLDNDQLDYLHRLQRGQAVVRYPNVPHAFCIEIPPFPLS